MQIDPESPAPPLLDLRGIQKTFRSRRWFGRSPAVVAAQDVSFRINRGQVIALVGESGSGKSTLARIILRLEEADRGELLLDGVDVLARERRHVSLAYRRRVQMVFQDPFGSLNSAHTVAHHLARPILRHHVGVEGGVRGRSLELLRTVGLEPAEEFLDRYPYELSGGQRQRVAIARALAVDPDILIADEPTSMLDVSIRMSVLSLLARLKEERQLAILLITHDLASARYLADRVLVLYRGRVVEAGACEEVVQNPAHPYTRALLASIADAGTQAAAPARTSGTHDQDEHAGCPFAARCPDLLEICRSVEPDPRAAGNRRVRCHLYPEHADVG